MLYSILLTASSCSCSHAHGTLSLLPNATNLITINSFGETVLFYFTNRLQSINSLKILDLRTKC